MTAGNPRSRPRLAIVLSHPTQYYSPWFRWLAKHSALAFRVFYLWDFGVANRRDPQFGASFSWDVDLLSGYDSEFVPNAAADPGTHHFFGLRNPRLPGRLAAWEPTALLLFGYKWQSQLRAIAWARRRRIPLIFRGDSHLLGRPALGWRRSLPLRWLYRRFAAVTYVGQANRDYFLSLGVSPDRLFFAPHSVDAERFNPSAAEQIRVAAELRARLGIKPQARVVLFAGKLTPAKGPRELLAAFLALRPAGTSLVFVGDGPEKEGLIAAARGGGAEESIHFLPFANQSEMPSRYLLSDLFALPSNGLYETWGLAVNEAMHMGLPCLVSDRVGCQQDLVTPGETGWVFRAGNADDLKVRLAQALAVREDPAAWRRLKNSVARRIAGYTYAETTEGLLRALESLPGWAKSPR